VSLRLAGGPRRRRRPAWLLALFLAVELATLSRGGLLGLLVGLVVLAVPYRRFLLSARLLVPLAFAAGVVAVYAEIASGGTDSAFVAMAQIASFHLAQLEPIEDRPANPLGDMFVALERGQLGASKIFANLPLSRNS